ncbi:hypothetical protein DFH09DRAFT_1088253 [Mycena vulgaris]|nr:hypothetical protein DFH09DRAFT_1088253 [Mycena vulgaris]
MLRRIRTQTTSGAPVESLGGQSTSLVLGSTSSNPARKPTKRTMDVAMLDEMASTFGDLVNLMRDYQTSAPTAACFDVLDTFRAHLEGHHEFPSEAEIADSFGALLTKSVSAPIQIMSAQLQSHQKALQSLSKSYATAASGTVDIPPKPCAKPRAASLPSLLDEHILVCCDGEIASLLQLPYHKMIPELNVLLARLSLPSVAYALHLNASSVFLMPDSKAAALTLVKSWDRWDAVDGIPFAAAGNLDEIAREFEARNNQLGTVVGSPTWVNRPPSEAMIAAVAAAGKKLRGGASFSLVQPPRWSEGSRTCALHNAGVASNLGIQKHSLQASHAPVRGAANSRTVPPANNCGGEHRADSFICPTRKRIAEHLRLRAVSLAKELDASSSVLPTSAIIRLVQINLWKSRNPVEILAGPEDFDIICTQEPNLQEVSRTSDVLVDFIFGTIKVTIINLYSNNTTRAGVAILRQLDPSSPILVVLDSNSHHPHWDSKTRTLIDHTLDFDVVRWDSTKFNASKMDLEMFLAILQHHLGLEPLPFISTQAELDEAASLICHALSAALEGSTPRHRPCSIAKRWWTPLLSELLKAALNRLKERHSMVFPAILDADTGSVALSHTDCGRVLSRAWFGNFAVEDPDTLPPDVTPELRVDQTGNGTRRKRGGVRSDAPALNELPPRADRQDSLPAPNNTSDAPDPMLVDPLHQANSIEILSERPVIEVTDTDNVILSSSPWKSPSLHN